MKKYIIFLTIALMVKHPCTGQTWLELLRTNGPVNFNKTVKAFENETQINTNENAGPETGNSEKEFESKDHLFYKWYNYNKTRLDENGDITNTLWRSLQAEIDQKQISSAESIQPHGTWQSIGPTDVFSNIPNPLNIGHGIGRVNSISFSGTDMFLSTASGGIWKGAGINTWQSISENIPNLSVTSVCVNPFNSSEIYALTGDGDGFNNGPSNTSIGVIKSTDGGVSWSTTGLVWTDVNQVVGFKMVMHPVNPETLFVASNIGIFRTLDGGVNWDTTAGFFTDIEFKPGNPGFMYAVSATNFYLTTTSGNGWTQMTQPVFTAPLFTRMAIAVSPNRPNWVYVLVGSNLSPFFIGLWLSTNSGVSFGLPRSSVSPCIFCDNNNAVSQAHYDMAFTANPGDAKELWMGGIKVYNSLDSGRTWNQKSNYYSVSTDIMHPDIHDLAYDAAGALWCANDGGIYKYTPYYPLSQWTAEFQGLNIAQYYRMGLDATPNYDHNYFGAQDNGLQLYDGDGINENVNFGDGGEVAVDYVDDTYYYNLNSRLMKSCLVPCDETPNTVACNCLDSNYNKNSGVLPNRPIVIDPINRNIIYHGLNCLFVSTDYADNFMPVAGFDCTGGMINDIDVTPISKWAIKDHKVLRETSPGVWSDVTNNLALNAVSVINVRIAANTTNPLEAYVCCGGYISSDKVFYTVDGGVNWYNLSAGLPNTPINDILYQNGSNGGYYAATDIGVYYINNNMFFWTPFRNGMPSVVVTELEINYGQNYIYASTYGRGAWRSNLIDVCPSVDATYYYPSLPSYSTIQANNTINAGSVFNKGYGQNVTLLSGYEINFPVGFEVSNGSVLTARIQNCPALKQAPGEELTGNLILSQTTFEPAFNNILHQPKSDFLIWPNPANEYCRLDITLKENSDLNIEILNLLGEKITVITDQKNNLPGNYRFSINVKPLKNGIYLIKTTYNNMRRVDKLVVSD